VGTKTNKKFTEKMDPNVKNLIFDRLKAIGGLTLTPSPSFYSVDMNI
jgi:hypothetical protein